MKAVTIGNARFRGQLDQISAYQLYPFFDNRGILHRKLGLDFKHIHANTFAEIEAASQSVKADIFFIRSRWQDSPAEAERVMAGLRKRNPNAKIIYIDPFDQTTTRFFNILPYVDCFFKQQGLKDVNQYTQPLIGGMVLTDRLTRELGYDLKGWHVGSEVPEGYLSRIKTGWFVTLTPRFKRELFRPYMPWERSFHKRDIDVFCHVSCGPRNNLEWYGQHRLAAHEVLQRLAPDYKLSISCEYNGERTVSTQQYFRDIRRSRIAFSPFGWGEITLRDYEAVCYGCLLVKPSVDHVDVEPNIFIPGETYVPVRWDYSDLEEKCRYYLENVEEANRIITNARKAYMDYFRKNRFVDQIAMALQPVPLADPLTEPTLPMQLFPETKVSA